MTSNVSKDCNIVSHSADLSRAEYGQVHLSLAASFLDQKLLSGQGLAPHLPSAQASARTDPPSAAELQPLYDFTFSLSPPFPGCQEPTGSCDVTNRLPALRKCWRIYGVHGAGEDKCILDADLSAQTSEPTASPAHAVHTCGLLSVWK